MHANDRIVQPGEGFTQHFQPGEVFTWKLTQQGSDSGMDFAELRLDAGVKVPEHIHHGNDEVYYILEGDYRFKVGDQISSAGPGSFVSIPRGTPHAWLNAGETIGRVAVIFTPGGMLGFFEELAPLLPDLMAGLTDMTKVDPDVLAKAQTIFDRYQYQIVGPPID
ncbi:MAG: hypothetical protein NVSMB57_04800 [Actinomycetota bacterium]